MIWDFNIRLFHVLLILIIILTIFSSKFDLLVLHQYFGATLLGLVFFRIYWGFFGSYYSRFRNFYYTPKEVYLFLIGKKSVTLGHNPLGSLSIFSFYIIISILSITGLFSSDDVLFEGPLVFLFPDMVSIFTKLHNFFHYWIYYLIALHISAISYYQFVKKDKIINQMIDGKSRVKNYKHHGLSKISYYIGFIILMVCIFVPSIMIFLHS